MSHDVIRTHMWYLRLYENEAYRYPVARPTYDHQHDDDVISPGSIGFLLGDYTSYEGVRLDTDEWTLALIGSRVIIINRNDFQEESVDVIQ